MKTLANRLPAILSIMLVLAIVAVGGCLEPPHRITTTVAPVVTVSVDTPTPMPTPTPVPTPAKPGVDVSGGTTTIKGSNDAEASGFTLGEGVYIVAWSGTGKSLSLSLNDAEGNGATDLSKGSTKGKRLFVVDGTRVYAGDFTLTATSDGDWTVEIDRATASSPITLPRTAEGSETDGAVIGPFRASAGDMWISYTLSQTPTAAGSVNIYDVTSGGTFYTRPIAAGDVIGQSMAIVPADGVYIAQVNFPPGSRYGHVTLSQTG